MRRFVSLLLVLAVLVFACSPPPAHATGVASTVALVGTLAMSLPVIAQLATMAMDAAGMTPALRVAASDAETPMQAFVEAAFVDFCNRNALAVGTALRVASVGARYYQDGSISFDSNLSDMFGGFLNYMWSSDGADLESSNPPADVSGEFVEIDTSGVSREGLVHPQYTYNIYAQKTTSITIGSKTSLSNKPTYQVVSTYSDGRPRYAVMILDENFSGRTVGSDSYQTNAYGALQNGITYYYLPCSMSGGGASVSPYPVTSVFTGSGGYVDFANDSGVIWDIAYLIYNGSPIGGGAAADPSILSLPENKDINILKPQDKMEGAPDFGPLIDAGATVAVADYIQSVFDGIENGDFSLPTADTATGESAGTIEGEMSQTQAMERAQALTSDLTAPGTGIVTDTAPAELGPYTLDLTAYFPFCIPFDLMYIFQMLQAEPEAPRIEYPFLVPGIIDTEIVIDLSPYDSVAQTLRTMELIAFAVALAFATKRLIQGGD